MPYQQPIRIVTKDKQVVTISHHSKKDGVLQGVGSDGKLYILTGSKKNVLFYTSNKNMAIETMIATAEANLRHDYPVFSNSNYHGK